MDKEIIQCILRDDGVMFLKAAVYGKTATFLSCLSP